MVTFIVTIFIFILFILFYFFFSKSEILSHKESNKKFYDHFAILSANYISYGSNDCKYFFKIVVKVVLYLKFTNITQKC